jgi:hypothetical protein
MKTFSEYLIEQGAVSAEDLLEVVLSQLKALPSICEIVAEKKLLPAGDIVAILAVQSRDRSDFVSACKAAGRWSDQIANQVWSELDNKRVPLVELLTREKRIDPDKLNRLLDSYFGEAVARPPAAKPAPIAVQEFADQFNEAAKRTLSEGLARPEGDPERESAKETLHRLAGAARFAKLGELEREFEALATIPSDGLLAAVEALWKRRETVLREAA